MAAAVRSFNAHVTDLATFISNVLSVCYKQVYGDGASAKRSPQSGSDRLVVMPIVVRDLADLMQAATQGVISVEAIGPVLMQSLGFSAEEIAKEEERRKQAVAESAAAGAPVAAARTEVPALAAAPPSEDTSTDADSDQ